MLAEWPKNLILNGLMVDNVVVSSLPSRVTVICNYRTRLVKVIV